MLSKKKLKTLTTLAGKTNPSLHLGQIETINKNMIMSSKLTNNASKLTKLGNLVKMVIKKEARDNG